jgi:hypothetical protein
MALTPRSLVRQYAVTDPAEAAGRIIDLEEAVHNALEALRVGENKVMRADTARAVLLKVHHDWRIDPSSRTQRTEDS